MLNRSSNMIKDVMFLKKRNTCHSKYWQHWQICLWGSVQWQLGNCWFMFSSLLTGQKAERNWTDFLRWALLRWGWVLLYHMPPLTQYSPCIAVNRIDFLSNSTMAWLDRYRLTVGDYQYRHKQSRQLQTVTTVADLLDNCRQSKTDRITKDSCRPS